MSPFTFDPLPLDQLDALPDHTDWLWDGLVARGDLALLTSYWKAGKTTLLAGLLDALDDGRPFLDRATAPARTLVVTEEPPVFWKERRRVFRGGRGARVLSRPFPGRPDVAGWDALVARAEADRAAGQLDLFVVDPLAHFLPGRSESHAGTLLDFLHPLRRLAAAGAAVLILHHPKKGPAEEGSAARGSGALLGYVDVAMELNQSRAVGAGENRRRVAVRSRHLEAPGSLVYEWAVGTPEFRAVPDDPDARFRESWEDVRRLMADRPAPASAGELADGWPEDRPGPSARQLLRWLTRAAAAGWAVRTGRGTRRDPFRFALPPRPLDPRDLPPLRPIA